MGQVREPFTAVRWLAENAGHNPLPSVLNIKPVVNRDTEMVKMHPADPRTLEVMTTEIALKTSVPDEKGFLFDV